MPAQTGQIIRQAFLELLDEKPINRITVKDITDRCGLNRNSFYYHYQDIPSMIEAIVNEQVDRLIEEYDSIDSIEAAMVAAADFAESSRKLVMHIYRSSSRDLFEMHLWRVCEYAVDAAWAHLPDTDSIPEEDGSLIRRFYRAQCFGIVMDWMREDMKEENLHRMISRFFEIRAGMLEEMLDRVRK